MLVLIAFLAVRKRKKLTFGNSKFMTRSASADHIESDPEMGSLYFGVSLFSYSELLEATDNFSESKELGDGGFGTVYYGKHKLHLFKKTSSQLDNKKANTKVLNRRKAKRRKRSRSKTLVRKELPKLGAVHERNRNPYSFKAPKPSLSLWLHFPALERFTACV